MEEFKLALVQHSSGVKAKEENLEQTLKWVRKANKAGAEVVCLPELGITGHAGHPAMVEQAEPVPGGPSTEALCDLARKLGIYVCAGIAEDDLGIHYNTQFIVGPEGFIGKQRKVHTSHDEYYYFRHGTDLPVLDLPMARVGIIICYDNHIPEMARCLAVQGAELLLCPHAARFGPWPKDVEGRRQAVRGMKDGWRRLHACRAFDNGCYVALCNATGRSAVGIRGVIASHAGGGMVFDPNGSIVAESRCRDIRDELLLVSLDGGLVAERRRQSCFNLQTRRPEVFKVLTEPTA